MAWFSYHGGHSGSYCHHAKDDLGDVVARAYELGFTHYGLAEHAPRYLDEHVYDEERARGITPADLEATFAAYVERACALRDEYAGRLEVLVGFETERLPGDWRERMPALRASAPFDFVVGSVHDIDGVWVDQSPEVSAGLVERCGGRAPFEVRYFEALAELVSTLRPDIVGHPDLVLRYDGPGANLTSEGLAAAEAVLYAARDAGSALDVNCGAWRRGGPLYPSLPLLRRARELGVRVTLGDDSHGVATVGAALEDSLTHLGAAGYGEVHYLARAPSGGVEWRAAALAEVQPARE
ncbi:MAG: histidinol-phosphatase [Planctomycetota bacterium]|nr:histidinol-phosphatase [Planctomycetota bacterium]